MGFWSEICRHLKSRYRRRTNLRWYIHHRRFFVPLRFEQTSKSGGSFHNFLTSCCSFAETKGSLATMWQCHVVDNDAFVPIIIGMPTGGVVYCLLPGYYSPREWHLLDGRTCDADERPISFQDCVGFHENRALPKTRRAVFLRKRPSRATYGASRLSRST